MGGCGDSLALLAVLCRALCFLYLERVFSCVSFVVPLIFGRILSSHHVLGFPSPRTSLIPPRSFIILLLRNQFEREPSFPPDLRLLFLESACVKDALKAFKASGLWRQDTPIRQPDSNSSTKTISSGNSQSLSAAILCISMSRNNVWCRRWLRQDEMR